MASICVTHTYHPVLHIAHSYCLVKKASPWACGDGSVVKKAGYSSREPGLSSRHSKQLTVVYKLSPVPGDQTDIHADETPVHIKLKIIIWGEKRRKAALLFPGFIYSRDFYRDELSKDG